MISNHFPIKTVSSEKYVGMYVDDELIFKEHIKLLESKVARSIGIMCKLKHIFPEKTLLQLYDAFIHPILTYRIII